MYHLYQLAPFQHLEVYWLDLLMLVFDFYIVHIVMANLWLFLL